MLGGPRQRLDLVTALRGWLDNSIAVVPEEQVYPKGESAQEAEQQSAAEMSESQENATTAALRQLGIPVQTCVVVAGPAGRLAVAGQAAQGRRDRLGRRQAGRPAGRRCARAVTAPQAGRHVPIVVRRDGKQRDHGVTTAAAPDDGRT